MKLKTCELVYRLARTNWALLESVPWVGFSRKYGWKITNGKSSEHNFPNIRKEMSRRSFKKSEFDVFIICHISTLHFS